MKSEKGDRKFGQLESHIGKCLASTLYKGGKRERERERRLNLGLLDEHEPVQTTMVIFKSFLS